MKKKSSIYPGFRFHPTDVELVMFHLKKKLQGKKLVPEVIADVNIYDFSPWDLPDKSMLKSGDREWFFFCAKSRKYSSGSRINRTTEAGYWKATGKDKEVKYKERTVAMIKTLVFHLGHPPKGERTDWVMHEYRMEDNDLANAGVVQDAYVISRLFKKSGFGPKNGAQYGAPFEEEEWDSDDDVDEVSCHESLGVVNLLGAKKPVNGNGNGSTLTNITLTEPGPSTITSSENEQYHVPNTAPQNNAQEVDRKGKKVLMEAPPSPNYEDVMFLGLDNLINLDDLSQDGFNTFSNGSDAGHTLEPFPLDDLDIELAKFF